MEVMPLVVCRTGLMAHGVACGVMSVWIFVPSFDKDSHSPVVARCSIEL